MARNLRFFADYAALTAQRGVPRRPRMNVRALPAGRRRGRDQPVELPADAGELEGGARARVRQHRGAQAGRAGAARRPRASAELALEAGLPPGVLNVVQGFGPDAGGEALNARRAAWIAITFTGESATGRIIAAAAGAT